MRLLEGVKNSLFSFIEDDCPTLAAALAYYTVFSLPPLIFLLVTTLTFSLSVFTESKTAEERARKIVVKHAATMLGNQTIEQEVAPYSRPTSKRRAVGGSRCWVSPE